jgi:hypothetical protein
MGSNSSRLIFGVRALSSQVISTRYDNREFGPSFSGVDFCYPTVCVASSVDGLVPLQRRKCLDGFFILLLGRRRS